MSAQIVADVLKRSVNGLTPESELSTFIVWCQNVGAYLQVDWFVDMSLTRAQAAMVMRGSIVDRLHRMQQVRTIAANKGYLLPDDPLPRYDELNSRRRPDQPLPITQAEADELFKATVDLSKVTRAYDRGEITFDRDYPAAQISSFEVSVDGISPQSGDALVDLLGYQPDADYIKKKRALDSLSRLDFSKRKPYILFLADVIRDGRRRDGTIVCWGKMRDASGYELRRRDVFAMVDLPTLSFSADEIARQMDRLRVDSNFRQLLSFYDWTTENDVVAVIDDGTGSNTLYCYEVVGVQQKAPSTPFIFDVPTSAIYLTPAQIEQVTAGVDRDRVTFGNNSVNPYPALSQVLYGDPSYGWILAGCNMLGAARRGALSEERRQVSYIGAELTSFLSLAAGGKLVRPTELSAVQATVESSISAYGISQTLLALLDGCGITLFISGKDDPDGFQPSLEALQRTGSGLAKIISAIDPATATVDPMVIISNMAARTSAGTVQQYGSQQVGAGFQSHISAVLGAPQPIANAAPTVPISQLVSTELIDLTTYVGIGRLMQVIRTVYDYFPGSLT